MADVCPNLPDELATVGANLPGGSAPAIDTSRHCCECLCVHCERDGMGQFAQRAATESADIFEQTASRRGYQINTAVEGTGTWRLSLIGHAASQEAARVAAAITVEQLLDALQMDSPEPAQEVRRCG